ncbi:MAG: hypothetical protein K2K60_01230 [Clostridia bacterium]|nr:hypothetical protein [Clostridia bacterium]
MNAYDVAKLLHPVKTTAHEGVDVHELVKKTFPKEYNAYMLYSFDWNDLDGVLDFLYGERDLGLLSEYLKIPKTNITEIIKLIEANCEVKK